MLWDLFYLIHDWSRDTTGGIRTHGRHFVACNLRGVNLFGNYKTYVLCDLPSRVLTFLRYAAPAALLTTATLLYIPCRCGDRHFYLLSIPAGRGAAASCTTQVFGLAGVSRSVSYLTLPRVLLRLPMPLSIFADSHLSKSVFSSSGRPWSMTGHMSSVFLLLSLLRLTLRLTVNYTNSFKGRL